MDANRKGKWYQRLGLFVEGATTINNVLGQDPKWSWRRKRGNNGGGGEIVN